MRHRNGRAALKGASPATLSLIIIAFDVSIIQLRGDSQMRLAVQPLLHGFTHLKERDFFGCHINRFAGTWVAANTRAMFTH